MRFILAASCEGSQGLEPKAIRCDGRFYGVDWLNLAGDSNMEQPGTAGFFRREPLPILSLVRAIQVFRETPRRALAWVPLQKIPMPTLFTIS